MTIKVLSGAPKSALSINNIEIRSSLYVVGLWGMVAATTVLTAATGPIGNPSVIALLAVVAAVAERSRVELSSNLSESISLVPTLFAAVVFGPLASMAVAAASFLPELRAPYLKWASYTA